MQKIDKSLNDFYLINTVNIQDTGKDTYFVLGMKSYVLIIQFWKEVAWRRGRCKDYSIITNGHLYKYHELWFCITIYRSDLLIGLIVSGCPSNCWKGPAGLYGRPINVFDQNILFTAYRFGFDQEVRKELLTCTCIHKF